jgi:outer membrane protein OmpA-like peptidoglycan-associated protein
MSLRDCFRGRNWLPLAITLVIFASAVAFAQEETTPKVDIFAGYSWTNPGGSIGPIRLNAINGGGGVASTWNGTKYLGLTVDSDIHRNDSVAISTIQFGPRLKLHQPQFQPFVEALFGLHRLSLAGIGTDNRLGFTLGGGFDIPVTKRFSFRLIEADYVWAHHNFFPLAPTSNLGGARLRTGLLVNLGYGPPPPPLAAACSINPTSVMAGEPVTMTVSATNIPKNHTVNYTFNSTGGKVTPKDNTAEVETTGMAPGNYTVTASVADTKPKKNETPATCNASFTIQEPPKHPPTISCSANPTTVQSGQPVNISCTGNSPDNRPLTYNCTATAGRLNMTGPNGTLDTAGLPAGPVTVNCTVTDDRGLSASTSTGATVEVPPPPPQASKLNEIQFKNKLKPARVDNEAKAILDDVALRLQREADAKAVVVGNFDPKEKNGEKIAKERAVNTKAYLTQEKGIDPSRIEVRVGNAGTQTAEIWLVPAGATFSQAGTQTFDESKVKAVPREKPRPARRPKPAKPAAPKQ